KLNENDFSCFSSTAIIEKILNELRIDHIDILLLHSPFSDYEKKVREIINIKKLGLIKIVGVSNFCISHLEKIKSFFDDIEINQIECHPYFHQKELLQYCQQNKIHIMAHRPFGKDYPVNDGVINEIATRIKKTPQQVILKWLVKQGMTVIPK